MSGQDNDTEEKLLPPSQWKLRKAREKGQIAASADFVRSAVTIIGIIFVVLAWTGFVEVFASGFDAVTRIFGEDFESSYLRGFNATIVAAGSKMVPLLLLLLIVAIVANILHKRGVVVSFHPIKPDLNRVNPAKGLKKLFGMRNFTEFAISLGRLLLWLAIAGLIIWLAVPMAMQSPLCGGPCILETGYVSGQRFLIAAVIMLIIAALVDLPVQFALFRREMRMSHRELKRELRDTQGAPEFKSHRRDAHRGMTERGGKGGIASASVIIIGTDIAVALRFNRKDSPVPFVIAKGEGKNADTIISSANKLGVPQQVEPELARSLFQSVMVGDIIRENQFQAVATVLIKAGGV
ncbi:MAG: EscU/YscU/HrcU family type III secretion system export apparatus switch protein [Hyphomicrobiales bacterium]